MAGNSAVFILIKSLSMSEKRYFKIFSERHTIGIQNKYALLFDGIDAAKVEDDKAISSLLTKAGFNSRFLSADKNYLYQLLLRSLNDFHHAKTNNIEIKEALISIEILFHKGLYKQCLKLVRSTEVLARDCENFQLMIDVLMWKKKCIGYSAGLKQAAEINSDINTYLQLQTNLKKITDLYYESNLLQASNEKDAGKSVVKKFKDILKQPELLKEENALSFSAKTFYHLVYSNYYYTIDNKLKELEHLEKLTALIKESKTYAVENPLDYVSIYNRLLSIKKYFPSSSFFNDVQTLREFSNRVVFKNEVVSYRAFIHCNTHELEYYLINNNYKSALSKTRKFEAEVAETKLDIEPYHMIYYYYLYIITLLYAGQFQDALKFSNKVLNGFDFEARPQVYIQVEILNAIVHYELGNYTLVLALCRQVIKRNKRQKMLSPFEEQLLNALTKNAGSKHLTFKAEVTAFEPLIEVSEAALKSNYNTESNYIKWVKAKIERKTVMQAAL